MDVGLHESNRLNVCMHDTTGFASCKRGITVKAVHTQCGAKRCGHARTRTYSVNVVTAFNDFDDSENVRILA